MLNTTIKEKSGVGVIVGRFQTPTLHEGHRELIETVLSNHEAVMVILGVSPLKCTKNNPLDFSSRRKMIETEFPRVKIMYIKDNPDDKIWVRELEELIDQNTPPMSKKTLYGSRDSFIATYKAHSQTHQCVEFIPNSPISGTKEREKTAYDPQHSADWRKGVCYALHNQYPLLYPTVDIAVIRKDDKKTYVLFGGKKIDNGKVRFIGGFVQQLSDTPNDGNLLRDNALRELAEETGGNLEVGDVQYQGSFIVKDWRYRGENDKIFTSFFTAQYMYGNPEAGDDLDFIQWVEYKQLKSKEFESVIVDYHIPLLRKLISYLDNIQ